MWRGFCGFTFNGKWEELGTVIMYGLFGGALK